MTTLLEGAESITLWCSLVVIAPTVVLALVASTGRAWLVGAAISATSTMMWARAGRVWEVEPDGAVRVLVGGAVIASFVLAHRRLRPAVPGAVAVGAISGAIAGWLWQPCVGEQLAEVLNTAETDRGASLLGMHAYVVGLSIPAILLVALSHAWPRADSVLGHRTVRSAGLVVALAYGIAVAVGWYDDLVSELFRLSST